MSTFLSVIHNGQSVTIDLDEAGAGLSGVEQADGSLHRYLNNACRQFVGDEVERALLALVPEEEMER